MPFLWTCPAVAMVCSSARSGFGWLTCASGLEVDADGERLGTEHTGGEAVRLVQWLGWRFTDYAPAYAWHPGTRG
jgi:hypothetical protein